MSNKSEGTKFEQEIADKLYENGWWVHLIQQNKAGQPADIIAVKGDATVLIDCKDCKTKKFDLSRVEENQLNAMKMFVSRSFGQALFVIKLNGEIYFINYWTMLGEIVKDTKSVNEIWLKNNKDNWQL